MAYKFAHDARTFTLLARTIRTRKIRRKMFLRSFKRRGQIRNRALLPLRQRRIIFKKGSVMQDFLAVIFHDFYLGMKSSQILL